MIRNFIYLDIEKLNSLSSQIFEGVTEYVMNEIATEDHQNDSQKGPFGSGRIVGDILRNIDKKSEKKFLVDYAYVLFEDELIKDKKVQLVEENSPIESEKINDRRFVKVRAKAVFNDMNSIIYTINNFNAIGTAITVMTQEGSIAAVRNAVEEQIADAKDRNARTKLERQLTQLSDPKASAKKNGLYQDPRFLESMSSVLSYGFKDQLEIRLRQATSVFSANLKRDCLREDEGLIIRKYSRVTSVEFVLFGIITQCPEFESESAEFNTETESDDQNLKTAVLNMINGITGVEATFTGRLANEYIIDPIAVYTEI